MRQIEERSRLMLRRNTRRVSRALGIGGGGSIPLKALMEVVKESNNNNNNNNSGDTEENRRKKNDEQQKVVKQISSVLGMTEFSMTEFSNHKKVIFRRYFNVNLRQMCIYGMFKGLQKKSKDLDHLIKNSYSTII